MSQIIKTVTVDLKFSFQDEEHIRQVIVSKGAGKIIITIDGGNPIPLTLYPFQAEELGQTILELVRNK